MPAAAAATTATAATAAAAARRGIVSECLLRHEMKELMLYGLRMHEGHGEELDGARPVGRRPRHARRQQPSKLWRVGSG